MKRDNHETRVRKLHDCCRGAIENQRRPAPRTARGGGTCIIARGLFRRYGRCQFMSTRKDTLSVLSVSVASYLCSCYPIYADVQQFR